MSTIKSSAENLTLNADGANNDIKFQSNGSEVASIDQAGVLVSAGGSTHADNVKAKFGTGNDMEIYHNGTQSYIENASANLLIMTGGGAVNLQKGSSEYLARFHSDGAAELYYDNSKKFETMGNGCRLPLGGLLFGSETSPNNELDAYEEGTFTPTGTNLTSASNSGYYIKIGKQVMAQGWITATGGNSATIIGGLPFTSAGTGNAQGGGTPIWVNADITGLYVGGNGTSFSLYGGSSRTDATPLASGNQMHFVLQYITT